MEEEIEQPKSTLLDEGEVSTTLNIDKPVDNTGDDSISGLPSDEVEFEMPDKFKGKSAEEIAKAYSELEKMKNKQTEDTPTEEPTSNVNITEEDTKNYISEYEKDGKLSEETLKALKDKGITDEQIQDQIDFYEYKKEQSTKKFLEPYGGKDSFDKAAQWARENMSQEQLTKLNERLGSGNTEVVSAALDGLFGMYNANGNTTKPNLTIHSTEPQGEAKQEGYKTKSDYLRDATDPRYDRDEGYRKQVAAKLTKTNMKNWY